MKRKKGLCIVLSFFLVLTIMSLASANILDDIKNFLTGQASSQPQDVSIQVVGKRPVTIEVPIISATPIELNSVFVTFTANVSDPDGYKDISDSSVTTFISNGITTRTGSCVLNKSGITPTKSNYSCSITMWYWDPASPASSWRLNVSASDKGNKTIINQSTVFTYNELKSLVISPSSLTWPNIASGDTNQNATNDPTIINNSGNYNGPIKITAIDLKGDTDPSESIPASSFSVGSNSLSRCIETALSNGTLISTSSNSNPGNLSAGGGAGQAQLYYCIPTVPAISSQTYSTLSGGSWTILY